MADISILSRLVNGAQRNVDLSSNTLVVGSLKISTTELTQAILDKLLLIHGAADADGTFDSRYTQIADLASTATGEGAALVGIEDDGGYYTGDTVEEALQQLGAAVGSGAAEDISYDNATSGLSATDVQAAIDETVALAQAAQTTADAAIPATEKGAAGGVATLDGGGKIPVGQLPSAVMTYEGTWDASTNDPELEDGTGDAGMVYLTTVAGTVDFGSGPIDFDIGDWAVYNGTVWQKSTNSNAVVSVNGMTGVVELISDDLEEGSTNLFFTDERAQAAAVADEINDGETAIAPSQNAVFDALALKQDANAALDEAVTFFSNTDITGAEAETLSAGGEADTLHSHSGLREALPAGESYAANTLFAVRWAKAADAGFVAGRVYKADNDATSADNFYVAGLVRPGGAISAGTNMNVIKKGRITSTAHGFTVGAPLFLGASGALTTTAPTAANSAVVRVGMVRDANTIEVDVQIIGVN